MNREEKLTYWIIFNVIIALLPLVFNLLFLFIRDSFPGFGILFFRGELLIISAAIAADAVGEFMSGTIKNKLARILIGGACVVLLALSSLLFAAISTSADQLGQTLNPGRTSTISVIVFFVTVVVSGISKFLAESAS